MKTLRKRGFVFPELVVALVLLGIVVALLLGTLGADQKVFRGLQERILVREQLRDGEQALVNDIRGATITADTLRLMADSAIELFSMIGSGVVCTLPTLQTLSLVPEGTASGMAFTSLPVVPDTGDLLSAYQKIDTIAGTRRWMRFRIASVTSGLASSACPPSAGFTTPGDGRLPSWKITVAGGTMATLAAGAPVRFLRRGRYSLYKSSDNAWYLGYKRCNAVAAGCSTIQPVSGPYLPYSSATGGGLRFRYLDSLGTMLPSSRPLDVASVEITFRAEVDTVGRIAGRRTDSALLVVTPRNFR